MKIKNELPNKESVELTMLGDLSICINGSSKWGNRVNTQRLIDTVTHIWQQFKNDPRIQDCIILRQIVVAYDFIDEVKRWAEQINEGWRVSSEGAVAQILVWGNGELEKTYAVIVLSEQTAFDLPNNYNQSLAIFIHELAHTHDNFCYIHYFGKLPKIVLGDWISIRRFIAYSSWSEFFAESIAYPYYEESKINNQISENATLLENALSKIDTEIQSYQNHHKAGRLWSSAINQLSGVFNQLGRCLGNIIVAQRNNKSSNYYNVFLKSISELSTRWEEVVKQLRNELLILEKNEKWENIRFNNLDEIIDNGFRASGLEPYK